MPILYVIIFIPQKSVKNQFFHLSSFICGIIPWPAPVFSLRRVLRVECCRENAYVVVPSFAREGIGGASFRYKKYSKISSAAGIQNSKKQPVNIHSLIVKRFIYQIEQRTDDFLEEVVPVKSLSAARWECIVWIILKYFVCLLTGTWQTW